MCFDVHHPKMNCTDLNGKQCPCVHLSWLSLYNSAMLFGQETCGAITSTPSVPMLLCFLHSWAYPLCCKEDV